MRHRKPEFVRSFFSLLLFGFFILNVLPAAAQMVRINHPSVTSEGPDRQTGVSPKTETDTSMREAVSAAYGRLPLLFEANAGQTDPQVRFFSRGSGYGLFLTSTEAVLVLSKPADRKGASPAASQIEDAQSAEAPAVLRMKLAGSNLAPQIAGQDESSSKSNYFNGNEPEKWRTNITNYTKVKYTSVYPGVDVIYYGNQGQLEYDFLVAPGANPQDIRLTIEGAQDVRLDGRGETQHRQPAFLNPASCPTPP